MQAVRDAGAAAPYGEQREGGDSKRRFFVNPDDAYEGHPSNGVGDPLKPVDDWILGEGEGKKDEEGGGHWGAVGGDGNSNGGTVDLAGVKFDVSFVCDAGFFLFLCLSLPLSL